MPQKYRLTADNPTCEGKAGDHVYKLAMHDYGLASDDSRLLGREHISVTWKEDGGYPSFTCPLDILVPIKES